MKMTDEQYNALENLIPSTALWINSIGGDEKENFKAWERMNKARQEARRLLVEDEPSLQQNDSRDAPFSERLQREGSADFSLFNRKYDGPCKGGPLDGSSMTSNDVIVQHEGGEYQWSSFSGDWFWVPDVDLDLTNPTHYKQGKVECIDAIESAVVNLKGIEAVCTGKALKYLWRWKKKGGHTDLRKAVWYINRLTGD